MLNDVVVIVFIVFASDGDNEDLWDFTLIFVAAVVVDIFGVDYRIMICILFKDLWEASPS